LFHFLNSLVRPDPQISYLEDLMIEDYLRPARNLEDLSGEMRLHFRVGQAVRDFHQQHVIFFAQPPFERVHLPPSEKLGFRTMKVSNELVVLQPLVFKCQTQGF
jgi:hypothetical protein